MRKIDLNCDMGESYKDYHVGDDDKIMPFITSCNIACGFHGGDPFTIDKTIQLAIKHNVKIGAHPSYPDLENFGRKEMDIPEDELYAMIKYQIAALKGMAESRGASLHHVKPHGALYTTAMKKPEVAEIIMAAVSAIDEHLLLYAPAGDFYREPAMKHTIKYINEAFADRHYEDDLTLTPRHKSDAVIINKEAALRQALLLAQGKIVTRSGKTKTLNVDTICIHGDHSGAALLAEALYHLFIKEGYILNAP